ncbi:MAG: radical SAM protein [Elusimicrobiota bacterium]|jgi:MoaA/NifB/PqqE/SkfB family radical SAM enzyme
MPEPSPAQADCYELVLNYNCDARCSFCSQGCFDKRLNARFEDIARAVYLGKKRGYKRLGLSGGEALLRPDLAKIVALGRSVGFTYIRLQTNGIRLADPRLCRLLVRAGLTFAKLTFASHRPEVHDALVGVKGAWRRTMAGLRHMKALKALVGVNILLNRRNLAELPATVRFFLDEGVSEFVVIYPLYLGSMAKNAKTLGITLKQASGPVVETLGFMEREGLSDGIKVLNMPPCFLPGFEDRAMGLYRFNTLVTSPDGRPTDLDEDASRARTQGPPCRACSLRRRCGGVDRHYPELYGWKDFRPLKKEPRAAKPVKPTSPARRGTGVSPVPRWRTSNEQCLLEILSRESDIPTPRVLALARGIPMCRDCRDGSAVLVAGERLIEHGLVARRFEKGKYYWRKA